MEQNWFIFTFSGRSPTSEEEIDRPTVCWNIDRRSRNGQNQYSECGELVKYCHGCDSHFPQQ